MNTYPISKKLLVEFMDSFFGYGNLDSPYWFIGKEEGGGVTLEENIKRIEAWETFGKTSTVDSIDYHKKLGFDENLLSKIQPTWTKLIQVILEIEGKDSLDKEIRRDFQRNKLGRIEGNNCCLELMPMASRSTGLWLWKDIFQDYFKFRNRNDYFEAIVLRRKKRLKELIKFHNPKLIHFYSSQSNYIDHWRSISEVSIWHWRETSTKFKFGFAKKNNILFIITPHPTAHGISLNDFPTVGTFIKENLQ